MVDDAFSADVWFATKRSLLPQRTLSKSGCRMDSELTLALSRVLNSPNMSLPPHEAALSEMLPASSMAALSPAPQPVAAIPSPAAQHVVRCPSTKHNPLSSQVDEVWLTAALVLGRDTTWDEQAPRPKRECLCGKRLSGRAATVDGDELCARCELRHHRGLPQLRKQPAHGPPAIAPAVAAVALSPDPPAPFEFLPEAASGYATRSAASDASFSRAEGLETIPPVAASDSAMGDAAATFGCWRPISHSWRQYCGSAG
jgi:hypothetical protein